MQVLTSDGWKDFDGVKKSKSNILRRLKFSDNSHIECTEEHRFMLPSGRFVRAKDCDKDVILFGNKKIKQIKKVIYPNGEFVYDLINVQDTHSYQTNGLESHNCLLLDEFGIIPQKLADEFFTAVYPTISSGKESKTIVISTPKGYNHFYKMFKEAEQGINGFVPVLYTWKDHPERNEKWAENEKRALGEEKFLQEHECEFFGSSSTLISSRILRTLVSDIPIHWSEEGLKIYENSKPEHTYFISCDPSRGTGNDNTAFTVLDITEFPFRIVASFENNKISPLILPSLLCSIGLSYNKAYILVEINDNGQQVADILWHDLEYENVVIPEGFHSVTPGLRTTKKTKTIGCSVFKDFVETQKLIVNDSSIIKELSNFTQKGSSYEADSGTDDLVMSLVNFSFYTTTDDFKNITDLNFRDEYRKLKEKYIEDDVIPFGFIVTGREEPDPNEFVEVPSFYVY